MAGRTPVSFLQVRVRWAQSAKPASWADRVRLAPVNRIWPIARRSLNQATQVRGWSAELLGHQVRQATGRKANACGGAMLRPSVSIVSSVCSTRRSNR